MESTYSRPECGGLSAALPVQPYLDLDLDQLLNAQINTKGEKITTAQLKTGEYSIKNKK